MSHTNEQGHVKTHRCLHEQESWSTRNALQAQLNAFHINYSSYKSEEWESLRSSACWDKKKWLFVHKLTETQMAFVAKNIFIIKAGYNKEFPDSMIDYKQWNSTPECIWGERVWERVRESESELEPGPVVLWECSPSWLAGFLILSEVIWWNRQKHNSNHVMRQSPVGSHHRFSTIDSL